MGGHADGLRLHASGKRREQAFDAAREPGRHRDDRLHRRARAAQVGVVVAVDQGLVVHRRVQRGEQRLLDADRAVQAVEHRDHGVGGAGRVRHQALGATQLVLVDAEHHRGIHILGTVARVGEQQARAAGVDEALQLAAAAVLPGALDDEVELERGPVDVLRRARVAHLDRMPVHDQIAFAAVHHARKTTVGGVEAGQVGDAGEVGGLVDRDDAVAPGEAGLLQGAQVAAADAAVAVDGDAQGALDAARRGGLRTGGGV